MADWEFIKRRTAADGSVWRSPGGLFYKRTGGADLHAEADFLRLAASLGYPVPEVVDSGTEDGLHFFTERTVGPASLHDEALASAAPTGQAADSVVHAAAAVSGRLLKAQARHPLPTEPGMLRAWFERAGLVDNVFTENPDMDTPRVRRAVDRALRRLRDLPMCHSNMDYGLPNAFRGAVIDWQHHGPAPLGYDVYPMLEIIAFKGGNKGYRVSAEQRAHYLGALDEASTSAYGRPLSAYLSDFLLVKCFFFLALMRPTSASRPDKRLKWHYRRTLFTMGLDQYESSDRIDTAAFPTLERFAVPAR